MEGEIPPPWPLYETPASSCIIHIYGREKKKLYIDINEKTLQKVKSSCHMFKPNFAESSWRS